MSNNSMLINNEIVNNLMFSKYSSHKTDIRQLIHPINTV